MTDSALKQRLNDDVKTAMRAKDRERLGVLRLITAAIKQREVDDRIELEDADITTILTKMTKQRRDSLSQFLDADRQDLADQEIFELDIIKDYMPEQLSEDEIVALVQEAISSTGASDMKDMGKVMGMLKPKLEGRADMGSVSGLIKKQLAG
jgi:uncharacterized protein YqeY